MHPLSCASPQPEVKVSVNLEIFDSLRNVFVLNIANITKVLKSCEMPGMRPSGISGLSEHENRSDTDTKFQWVTLSFFVLNPLSRLEVLP